CEIMKKQIDYLSENKELFIQDLNVEKIMDNQEKYLKIYSSKIKTKIKNNFNVLVRPDPYFNSDKIINRLRVRKKLSFRDISLNIRGFLGRLSFEVVESDLINKLILTGGDTAQGVCFALGIKKLYVLKEILPGIPLLYGSGENGRQLQIVTKAGGFGRKDSLIKLLNSLSD
ncbi:MAG: nucleotide-binding domain containing protein, partial [Bacillota bacterium]